MSIDLGTVTIQTPGVQGAAASTANFAAPDPIGSGTPNTGAFTTITASSTLDVDGIATIGTGTGSATLSIDGGAGASRIVRWMTNNTLRWLLMANTGAESGSNAGSNLQLLNYSDAGSSLSFAITVTRSTGNVAFAGNVAITGALSKGSGTFHIDHPLDPENKFLDHGFVESGEYLLIYRGRVQLEAGTATVNIDTAYNMSAGTFAALAQNPDFTLQNQSGFAAVRGSFLDATLTIECEDNTSTDTVTWIVVAERADAFIKSLDLTDSEGHMIVEYDKPELDERLLNDIERSEVKQEYTEHVFDAAGKRGYPLHHKLYNVELPTRKVKPKAR